MFPINKDVKFGAGVLELLEISCTKEEGRGKGREMCIAYLFLSVFRISVPPCGQNIYPHLIHHPTNTKYLILAQNIFPCSGRSHNKLQSLLNKSLSYGKERVCCSSIKCNPDFLILQISVCTTRPSSTAKIDELHDVIWQRGCLTACPWQMFVLMVNSPKGKACTMAIPQKP